jgi:hypothetical protein
VIIVVVGVAIIAAVVIYLLIMKNNAEKIFPVIKSNEIEVTDLDV